MSSPVVRLDRRHLRRAETIAQIVDTAVDVMADQGVAGLSLGEVARRMGIRPPSLYGYFASKNAVYDAVFQSGWEQLRDISFVLPPPADDPAGALLLQAMTFVRWNVEHPVHAQLMSWRPVPGYEPSPEAYAPAVQVFERGQAVIVELQDLGVLDPAVPPDELFRCWTAALSGVMTQQLANAPHEPFDTGSFTTLLPQVVAMYLAHFAPGPDARPHRRGRHADERRPDR